MPTWPVLKARGKMLAAIRQFFEARSVTEVSTPTLSRSGTVDVQLASFEVSDKAGKLFLQTSPEYALKRALAFYGEAIFEITPAFRRGDHGRQHNPEFTMLEWYRPGLGLTGLMAEVVDLLNTLPDPPRFGVRVGPTCRFIRSGRCLRRALVLIQMRPTCRAFGSGCKKRVRRLPT